MHILSESYQSLIIALSSGLVILAGRLFFFSMATDSKTLAAAVQCSRISTSRMAAKFNVFASKSCAPSELKTAMHYALHGRFSFVLSDGRRAHKVFSCHGIRYSVVFYTVEGHLGSAHPQFKNA